VSLKRQQLPVRQLLKQNCHYVNAQRAWGTSGTALELESGILTCEDEPLDVGQSPHLSYSRKSVMVLILQIIGAASMKALATYVSTINMASLDPRFSQRCLWRVLSSGI
jgi:hypothetical protein